MKSHKNANKIEQLEADFINHHAMTSEYENKDLDKYSTLAQHVVPFLG